MPGDPLSKFPRIRTQKPEEFEDRLVNAYGATKLHMHAARRLNARGNWIQLQSIALGFSACEVPAAVSFGECDFARIQLALRGHGVTRSGKHTTLISVGQPCLTSAHREATFGYEQDFEHLVLRVNADALEQKIAPLIGAQPRGGIEFEPAVFSGSTMLLGLQRLVETLISLLEDDDAQLSSIALRELEQAVIVQFLLAGRHNLSSLLDRSPADAAPHCVRLAEAYIDANWNCPIMIENLVEVSGVSARSLFNAFKRWRGLTPAAFARKIRLERSLSLLSKAESVSVTAVALACGFSSLGHFAREYRDMFGELPSQTVARYAAGVSRSA